MLEPKLQNRTRDTNNPFWLQKHLKELQFSKLREWFSLECHSNATTGQKNQFTDQLYSKLDSKFKVENTKVIGLDPAGKEKADKD